MFSKRAMAFLAILYVTMAAAEQQQQRQQRHQVLENKDLTDLLDAELDEPFQQAPRRLQDEEGMTQAPSAAPTAAPQDSADVGGEDGERGFETFAPTPMPRDLPTDAPVTSGASSWRPSASVASALVLVGSVAAAVAMA